MNEQTFDQILTKYREISFSQKDKGERFERLMQGYLLTEPIYAKLFEKVWLWLESKRSDHLGHSRFFTLKKMRFPKKGQKDTIIYNSKITISNIPNEAYEYLVNGKSAIEWIMERYAVTTHKDSGIKNDPNDWANEVGNPRYILDLLLSVINVSVQTVEIVKGLPKVKFD